MNEISANPFGIASVDVKKTILFRLDVQEQSRCQQVCKDWQVTIESFYSKINKNECWANRMLPDLTKLPLPIKQALAGIYKSLPFSNVDFDKCRSDELTYGLYDEEGNHVRLSYPIMRGELQKQACVVIEILERHMVYVIDRDIAGHVYHREGRHLSSIVISQNGEYPTLECFGENESFIQVFIKPTVTERVFKTVFNEQDSYDNFPNGFGIVNEKLNNSAPSQEIIFEDIHIPFVQKILNGDPLKYSYIDRYGRTIEGYMRTCTKEDMEILRETHIDDVMGLPFEPMEEPS